MPNNNHFVVVSIDNSGFVTIYNELVDYDSATKNMLLELGFSKSKIRFHPNKGEMKFIQPDTYSCGDRGFRNIFRLLGVEHPIVNAVYSSELRKNTIQLIWETLIHTNEQWQKSRDKIAECERDILALQSQKSYR